MDTYNYTANDLFSPSDCVMIPRFQRRYSWGIEKAHNLIRDIAEVSTRSPEVDGKREPHWIGAVIYRVLPQAEKCLKGQGRGQHRCREIIDGQQRLTTIRLWTIAILHHAESVSQEVEYDLTDLTLQKPNDSQLKAILEKQNVFDQDDPLSTVYCYFRFLLWLGQAALLEPEPFKPLDKRVRGDSIVERWTRHMEQRVQSDPRFVRSGEVDCTALLDATINDLTLLGIELKGEDPAKVFESLNGRQEPLGQFDHLRNWVFSEIKNDRDEIFDATWGPSELIFNSIPTGKGRGTEKLKSIFLYDYLISLGEGKFGTFNASSSFSTFTRFYRSGRFNHFRSIEHWVLNHLEREVKIWKAQQSHFYEAIDHRGVRLDLSVSGKRSLQRIRVLSDGPPSPLVMVILRCGMLPSTHDQHVSPNEVALLLRQLEGYMFKVLLAEDSLTNFRSEIIRSMYRLNESLMSSKPAEAGRVISKYIADLATIEISRGVHGPNPKYIWKTLKQNIENWHKRVPAIGVYDTLKPAGTLALLDVIDEEFGSARSSGFLRRPNEESEDPYWVEHIYPQSPKKWINDLKAWAVDIGEMNKRVHALGNLTALERAVNVNIKDKRFDEKKGDLRGIPMVATKLNDWMDSTVWTPEEIDARTHLLLSKLANRWPD